MFASNWYLCLILNNKFYYIWKDWYTGEKHSNYLEDAIAYKEKTDMYKIKLSVCLKWLFFLLNILVSLTKIFLHNIVYIFLLLTHILSMLHFCTPWKCKKNPSVFWRFQGVQICNIGRIWVKLLLEVAVNRQKKIQVFFWLKITLRFVLWELLIMSVIRSTFTLCL